MIYKKLMGIAAAGLLFAGCTSKTIDSRYPAGTGDIDSSTPSERFESYKLPITRDGKKSTRVAHNFWSREWPEPIIDVNADIKGTTTIQAYTNLRDPKDTDKVSCTIKNGLYHPWSTQDSSINTYYTLIGVQDYTVIRDTTMEYYNRADGSPQQLRIPKASSILNVVYYAENYCGAILKTGRTQRPISASCDFFLENKDFKKIQADTEFYEQWLYLTCEEKDASGKVMKAFVRDQDILKQSGVKQGCHAEYGTVKSYKNCN